MWSIALCFACFVQLPIENFDKPAPSPNGWWAIRANGHDGKLNLADDSVGTLTGQLFGDPIRGSFNHNSQHIIIERLKRDGSLEVVQIFRGKLERVPKSQPPEFVMSGTFESVGGADWGQAKIEFPWLARPTSAPPELLEAWQGIWDVTDQGGSSGVDFVIYRELGFPGKTTRATIRGNQLLVEDKLIATLTTDFSQSNLKVQQEVRAGRSPILFTLPSGKGIMCAAKTDDEFISVVNPHGMGNVGSGSRFFLKRFKKDFETKD